MDIYTKEFIKIKLMKYGICVSVLLIIFIYIHTIEARADEVISSSAFGDPALYEYVLDIADADDDGVLMQSEIETVTNIELVEKEIYSLIGVELCVNLVSLNIAQNYSIYDLSPLSNMANLEYLDISRTAVNDYSVIATLPKIKSLILLRGHSNDFSVLKSITTLEEFIAAESSFDDISVLSGSVNTLKVLDISSSGVSDLSYLANFKVLEKLEYDSNFNRILENGPEGIKGISAISDIVTLKHLSLFNNMFTELSDISKLTQLEYLDLSGNSLTEVKGIDKLTNLKHLILSGNNITSISGLAEFTELVEFNINGNSIAELEDMSSLTKLETVDISNNLLTKVPNLSNSTNLSSLFMYYNYFNNSEIENAAGRLPANITSATDWKTTTRITEQHPTTDTPIEEETEDREIIADEGEEVIISGNIEEGVHVSGTKQDDITKYQDIIDKINEEIKNIHNFKIYDIFMYKYSSSNAVIRVQPNEAVEVKIKLEDTEKNYIYSVFRQEEDGTLTKLNCHVISGYLYFESDHFSIFTIVMSEIFGEEETSLREPDEKHTINKEDISGLNKEDVTSNEDASNESTSNIDNIETGTANDENMSDESTLSDETTANDETSMNNETTNNRETTKENNTTTNDETKDNEIKNEVDATSKSVRLIIVISVVLALGGVGVIGLQKVVSYIRDKKK